MPNQEIDNNEIEDSDNVSLSETSYNLYIGALARSCDRVIVEYDKYRIKITGKDCGCQRKY